MADAPVSLFDAIGPPVDAPPAARRTGIATRSSADRAILRKLAKANPHQAGRELQGRLTQRAVKASAILTPEECQKQASLIATLTFEAITAPEAEADPDLSASDRKNLAVMWGVAQDKLRTWREAPDLTPATPPGLRPGIRDLIRRLVAAEGPP